MSVKVSRTGIPRRGLMRRVNEFLHDNPGTHSLTMVARAMGEPPHPVRVALTTLVFRYPDLVKREGPQGRSRYGAVMPTSPPEIEVPQPGLAPPAPLMLVSETHVIAVLDRLREYMIQNNDLVTEVAFLSDRVQALILLWGGDEA